MTEEKKIRRRTDEKSKVRTRLISKKKLKAKKLEICNKDDTEMKINLKNYERSDFKKDEEECYLMRWKLRNEGKINSLTEELRWKKSEFQ